MNEYRRPFAEGEAWEAMASHLDHVAAELRDGTLLWGTDFPDGTPAGVADGIRLLAETVLKRTAKYRIIRFYRKSGRRRVIKRNRTLREAQAHCSDPSTKKEGVYFDGYEKQ